MHDDKVQKGFFLAPIMTSAVFGLFIALAGLVSDLFKGEINLYTYFKAWLIFFISALPVSYSVTIIFGIPAYYGFNKKYANSLKFYIIGGAILGVASPVLLLPFLGFQWVISLGWAWFLMGSFFGLLSSYFFWLIAIKDVKKI